MNLKTAFFIATVGGTVLAGFMFLHAMGGADARIGRAAAFVIRACADATPVSACYDREIPKLAGEGFSMEEMFQVAARIQKETNGYWYCHVLGHTLGGGETAKDPLRWAAVIARCPVNMCSNGCIHGAFQERYRRERVSGASLDALVANLKTACIGTSSRAFTMLEKGSCYHAVGHLMMYATRADISTSLALCDRAKPDGNPDIARNMAILCYHGAFMQLFQPLDITDKELIKDLAPVAKDGVRAYCGAFDTEQKGACMGEAWPLSIDTFHEASGIDAYCTYAKTPIETYRCYENIFYILASQFALDERRIASVCDGFPAGPNGPFDLDLRGQCYGNAASRFLDTDTKLIPRAVGLCAHAESAGGGERCYNELLFDSIYDFGLGSASFNALCSALPAGLKERCLAGEGERAVIHP